MTRKLGAKGRNALKRSLLLAAVLGIAALVISRTESPETRALLFRGLLVVATGIGGWALTAALRRALRAQRAEPLEAPERSLERLDQVPLQLRRLQAELERAHRGGERYERDLGARLRSIARRRAALRGLSEPPAPSAPEAGPGGTGGSRGGGPSTEEISRIVRRLEEM